MNLAKDLRGSNWSRRECGGPCWRCALVAVTTVAALVLPSGAPLVAGVTQEEIDEDVWGRPYQQLLDRWGETWDVVSAGRYDEAEGRAREMLRLAESRYGPDEYITYLVLDLLVESLLRGGKSHQAETVDFAQRAVSLMEKAGSQHQTELRDSLIRLAVVLEERGELADARTHLERAVAIQEQCRCPDRLVLAGIYNNLAILLKRTGEYQDAKLYLLEALDIEEDQLGAEHPDLAGTLGNLGSLLHEMGELQQAKLRLERAVRITEAGLGPGHPQLAQQLSSLGNVLVDLGAYNEARAHLEQGLSIRKEVLGPDHPAVASSLGALGLLYIRLGDERAGAFLRRAIEMVEDDNAYSAAGWLVNLAMYEGSRDYGSARRWFERALEIFERIDGLGSPRVAWAHLGMGNLLAEFGDYREAELHLDQAVRICQTSVGPKSKFTTSTLSTIADTYANLGRHASARDLLEGVLESKREEYGPDHPEIAGTLEQMARLERRFGDMSRAYRLAERARTIRESAKTEGIQIPADALQLYAAVRADAGELVEARRLLDRAVAGKEAEVRPEDPQLGEILRDRAEVDLRLGSEVAAYSGALRAEAITRRHLRYTISSLSEREGLRYANVRAAGLDLALTIAASGTALDDAEAFDAVIRSRAIILDEMAARHRSIVGANDPQTMALFARLQAKRTQIARVAVRGLENEEIREVYDQARADKERLERDLSERSLAFRLGQMRDEAGIAEVANALPTGTALVSYVRYVHLQTSEDEGADLSSGSREAYLAFVMRDGDSRPLVVPLAAAAEIDSIVRALRRALSQVAAAPGRSTRRAEAVYRQLGGELRKAVWDPVAPLLKGVESTFVVPDGALSLINLAALPVAETGYLIETGPHIHYLSAERDLIRDVAPPIGRGLLAIGAPSFDDPRLFAALRPYDEVPLAAPVKMASLGTFRGARSSCGDFQTMRFDTLPAAQEELDEVVAVWRAAAGNLPRLRGQGSSEQTLTLSGAAASEGAFKTSAPGRRVLHLATHGFFLGERCPSVAHTAETRGVLNAAAPIGGENPLLLSGFALAGANHREAAGPDDEDGILTAEEIAALDLTGVEWAVLSACDTGIGKIQAGEGVFGLRRAFQVAGARTLIMSLWPVEDEASREWMTALYKHRFEDGLSTIEAAHRTTVELLQDRRVKGESTHPFFWAGFIASGDWR